MLFRSEEALFFPPLIPAWLHIFWTVRGWKWQAGVYRHKNVLHKRMQQAGQLGWQEVPHLSLPLQLYEQSTLFSASHSISVLHLQMSANKKKCNQAEPPNKRARTSDKYMQQHEDGDEEPGKRSLKHLQLCKFKAGQLTA